MADSGKMTFTKRQAPTKIEMREMLARAVRNTVPELNPGPAPERKAKRKPRRTK